MITVPNQKSSRPISLCIDPGDTEGRSLPRYFGGSSPCNIIHSKPIKCESKAHLKYPLAECDVDYLLKNQKAEVHRMRCLGQKGCRLLASPVTASPSPEQREFRLKTLQYQ